MNIDRHNYEAYFILYMDNELKPAERRLVESFVQLHPDLKDELDLLLQFKLAPDESVVYHAKNELLKKEHPPVVNESNYNEWLLLYVDNELTTPEKLLVDQFLATNQGAQKEFSSLQQTRLIPEEVIFADKSSLYRREEKVRKIPLRFWRVAAAAVILLGIGLTTLILVNRKDNPKDEIVNTNPGEQIDKQEIIIPKQAPVVANNNLIQEKPDQIVDVKKKVEDRVELKKPDPDSYREVIPENKKEEVVAQVKDEAPTNNLPKPVESHYVAPTKTFSDVALSNNNATNDVALKQAVTIETTPTSNNPEDIEEPGKKSKLRGFFRKVARTFEKRANIATTDDENKLLVAGLAFKLK